MKPSLGFVPLQLPASSIPIVRPDIRIELERAELSVSVAWPASASADCAIWLRELLR